MEHGIAENPEWHEQAECRKYDYAMWWYDYPDRNDRIGRQEVVYQVLTAIRICQECPVKNLCLKQGLEPENLHNGSIWGGLIYSERKALVKGTYASGESYSELWLRHALRTKIRLTEVKNNG